jgi:hypothetical protein
MSFNNEKYISEQGTVCPWKDYIPSLAVVSGNGKTHDQALNNDIIQRYLRKKE